MPQQGFPGTGPIGQPLPSSNPIIPEDLIPPAVMQKVRDMLNTEQMKKLASEGTQAKFERVVEKMLTTLVTQSLDKMARTPSGAEKVGMLAASLAHQGGALGTAPGTGGPTSRATPAGAIGGAEGGAPTASTHSGGYSMQNAYHEGRSVTSKDLAHRVAGVAGGYFSQRSANWNVLDEATDADTIARLRSEGHEVGHGSMVHYDGNGNVLGTVNPDDPNYASSMRRVRMMKGVTGGLVRASRGEGLLSGRVGMMAGKAAGVAGMVVTGVQATGHFLENQNQKASTYRADFGGDGTGMFAARERLGEFTAGLKGFGTIGGDQARENYRAASALGLRGGQRDEATGFAKNMSMKYGMSGQDAFAIVQQALETGNVSLDAYAESISKVTKAAVDGGRSAASAIRDLTAAQAAVAQQTVGGTASLAIAQNASTAVSGMNRETAAAFGGAAGLATSTTSERAVMLGAARTGQDPMAALFRSQAGGVTSIQQQQSTAHATADSIVTDMANFLKVPVDQIKKQAKGITNPERQFEILLGWAGGDQSKSEIAIKRLMVLIPTYGLRQPQNATDALGMFFTIAAGGITKGGDTTGGLKTSDKTSGYRKVDPKSTGSVGMDQANQSTFVGHGGKMGRGAAQYLDMVAKTGKGSASIEGLLSYKADKAMQKFTGHGVEDAKYIVTDSKGNTKKVGLSDVLSNASYRSQLAKGDILVEGKGHEQKQISEFTGVDTEPGVGSSGGKSKGKGGDKGSQKVEITFTGAAERLLRVSGPTDAERSGMPSSTGVYNPDLMPGYGGQ